MFCATELSSNSRKREIPAEREKAIHRRQPKGCLFSFRLLSLRQNTLTMAKFGNFLKGSGGSILGSIAGSVVSMVAGKIIADKMQKKILKQQTGFETTEEIMADAQLKAAKAQADAEAQARAYQEAQAQAQTPKE